MKRSLLVPCLIIITSLGFRIPEPQPNEDFCSKLKTMLAAAKDGFGSIKGEPTTRMITGHEKKYYMSTLKFVDGHECYINDVTSYPECECLVETDTRITEKLSSAYESYKTQIQDCLGDEWVVVEKDATNDYYLEGTKYKKLDIRENITGKKIKFHLYLYSNMIEKKRVVELKFEGIGKK